MMFDGSDVLSGIAIMISYATYRQGKDPSENKRISDLLEDIYFSSDGVISLVEGYANGVDPDEDLKSAVLTEFNDWEFYSNSWISLLDADSAFKGSLTISKRKHLQSVLWNKVQVREAVQGLIGNGYREVSQGEAKSILKRIQNLNKAVEEAQDLLKA